MAIRRYFFSQPSRVVDCHNFGWSRSLWAKAARDAGRVAFCLLASFVGLGVYLAYTCGYSPALAWYYVAGETTFNRHRAPLHHSCIPPPPFLFVFSCSDAFNRRAWRCGTREPDGSCNRHRLHPDRSHHSQSPLFLHRREGEIQTV